MDSEIVAYVEGKRATGEVVDLDLNLGPDGPTALLTRCDCRTCGKDRPWCTHPGWTVTLMWPDGQWRRMWAGTPLAEAERLAPTIVEELLRPE